MASRSRPVRARLLWPRRGLVLAGLLTAAWAVTRVVLQLSGHEDLVVAESDRHGYMAVFSLVLVPFLLVAVVTLVADTVELWRHGRSRRVGSGVALLLSAPLAGGLALVAAVLGVALIATALVARSRGA
ncbi:hypothetical protein [Amycolatopsis magusensis]|uniref:hypothetical protein n=1 Tax=Amycolatopsis magusensis TaxID=882444 RepID=UPI00378DD00F